MTVVVTLAPEAAADIERIGDYINTDNPRAAFSFVRALRERCDRIAYAPAAGAPRPELRAGLRSVAFRSYVIFYTSTESAVRVERVLHGRQDIGRVFSESGGKLPTASS